MDLARKILENYGWKEGDGLGKNKNGIAKPLKASLKFDNAGFGADQAADDFNNHWWERVFNEAATNVNVRQEGEKVKLSLKDDSSVEISTKGYSMKKLKKLKKDNGESVVKNSYENFLRSATLTNLGSEIENADKIDTHDIEVSKVNVLTDEELFNACGGRTAHKGARHGLKLSGKLSRIEQQDAELLAKMMKNRKSFSDDKLNKSYLPKIPANVQDEMELAKEHKLKRKERKHSEQISNEGETSSELAFVKSRKKKMLVEYDASNMSPFLGNDNHDETHLLKKVKMSKHSSCLKEKSSRKKRKKNKKKCVE